MRTFLVLLALSLFTVGCKGGSVSVNGARVDQPPPSSPQPADPHPPPGANDPVPAPVTGGAPTNGASACAADPDCPKGYVCMSCGDQSQCVPGCRTNDDCGPNEKCEQVACIRCPCPPLCQQL